MCTGSLFLRWGTGGYFLGGYVNNHVRERTWDGYSFEYTDRYEYSFNQLTNWIDVAVDGRHRPLAALAPLMLGFLLATVHNTASAPPRAWVLIAPAALVSVWGLVGLSGDPGPCIFLAGVVVVDAAVVFLILNPCVQHPPASG